MHRRPELEVCRRLLEVVRAEAMERFENENENFKIEVKPDQMGLEDYTALFEEKQGNSSSVEASFIKTKDSFNPYCHFITCSQAPYQDLRDVVDIYQREFLALRDRLHAAEQENLKRSKELNLVLDEIKRTIAEKQTLKDFNRTWSNLSDETKLKLWNITISKNVLQLPSIFHHLPHLLAREDSFQPSVYLGQRRTGVSIVMGVPTVKREVHSYLIDTLNSLIYELTPEEKQDCVIVVLIAETDLPYVNSVAENLKNLPQLSEWQLAITRLHIPIQGKQVFMLVNQRLNVLHSTSSTIAEE
ncbi:alpha-1,3-mannosyl-glycoprotein 4-beta-N-acetylglucosaminyltransferase B-like [Heterodontus francisci]|uniref:alpha-1,3-mannosyl-glycoprotein 4-beta-N-acetylglucosaminyltransferase B-like n=1 Tax=Heterodontus francisci TaxID=7792 RepID=UPI00355C346E